VNPPQPAADEDIAADRAIHREILQIGLLVSISVLGFFVTRAVAINNRDVTYRNAEAWYQRGQEQMAAGRLPEAIESLRRAAVRNRYDRRYVLALAQALALNDDTEAARAALLTVRESAPDDAEINLALARLAVRRQDVTEALRFYHNALYAPWPAEAAETRRGVRLELIEFLLQHDQTARALAELLAVTSDLPDDASTRVRVGDLFARAGDHRHALEQFERALRTDPANRAALAGAGLSAFRLHTFTLARAYLRRAPASADGVAHARDVAELVLSRDPLARRIGATERRRRLIVNLDYVQRRLAACDSNAAAAESESATLQRESNTLRQELRPQGTLDQDMVEAGIDLLDRIERHISTACGPPSVEDEAVALIAQQHVSEKP
jgi:tetratricopeptide (TPR) repeat protein